MNCQEFKKTLEIFDAELEISKPWEALKDHWDQCPTCKREAPDTWENITLVAQLKTLTPVQPPKDYFNQLPGHIRSQIAQDGRGRQWIKWGVPALATTFMVLFLWLSPWQSFLKPSPLDSNLELALEVFEETQPYLLAYNEVSDWEGLETEINTLDQWYSKDNSELDLPAEDLQWNTPLETTALIDDLSQSLTYEEYESLMNQLETITL